MARRLIVIIGIWIMALFVFANLSVSPGIGDDLEIQGDCSADGDAGNPSDEVVNCPRPILEYYDLLVPECPQLPLDFAHLKDIRYVDIAALPDQDGIRRRR